MSTRANIVIIKGKETKQMYHHYDGYPQGVGKDLHDLISVADRDFDSAEDLAQYLSSRDKQFESEESSVLHADIEYLYVVDLGNKVVRCLEVENWDGLKIDSFVYVKSFDEPWDDTL